MDDFKSISGAAHETTEPIEVTATISATAKKERPAATPKGTRNQSSTTTLKRQQLQPKRSASANTSPLPSRESSPVRPPLQAVSRSTGPGRSRNNSANEVSPSRPASSNPPSSAAQQRVLSAATTPTLHPASSEPTLKAPVPQKLLATSELKDSPRWPVSPRLRSPPPISRPSITSPRKVEQDLPSTNVQKPIPKVSDQEAQQTTTDTEADDSQPLGMRTPARGVSGASSTLETVQEISQPNTPSHGLGIDGAIERAGNGALMTLIETDNRIDTTFSQPKKSKQNNESGSESGGKGDLKMKSTTSAHPIALRSAGPATKSYSANTTVGRGKAPGEGSTRNMTVETETVSSIPQIAVGGTAGAPNNGSIRAKLSSETIRPKKEKKKTARKTPSVTSGTASSKADIFEAKVASAVDEANSSDSEETFVYESNPPDANDRPRRFHSRTPSATSMASQVDQRNGSRSIMDGVHSVAMKKSMKFANSFNTNAPDVPASEDDGKATIRSTMGTGRGTTHHHHIGRWGRNGGNGHASLFDTESPFPNAAKSKLSGTGNNSPRLSSRPTSPRVSNARSAGNGKKTPILAYDMDDGADDERTPLMSSIRSNRSARNRRPAASSMRQLEHQASRQHPSCLARSAGCLVLTLMILLVVFATASFVFATTQPLTDFKVIALKNVLASEQDLIFDLKVQGRNPNIVVVTIDTADLVVFAKSKYAGTDSEWWNRPKDFLRRAIRRRDDNPPDPPLDGSDPGTNPNLEIGHVYELDTSLTFDGSPFHHSSSTSTGQVRIGHPGNHTMPAGSDRWGNVLQHEFDLIVRGHLEYTLPLSKKLQKVSVDTRVTVKPNAADQEPDDLVHII